MYPDLFLLLLPYALLAGLFCFVAGYVCGVRDKEKSLTEDAKRHEAAGQWRIKE